jgi:hypothetical protein
MLSIEEITKRIQELKDTREQLLSQANLQLGKLTGAIEELERLIIEPIEPKEESLTDTEEK